MSKRGSGNTNAANNTNTSSSVSSPIIALDAAAVGALVGASLEGDVVAAAMNISSSALTVTVVGELRQGKTKRGACLAGKYVAAGMGECSSCAPGRAAPKGSSNCSHCDPGTFAAQGGSPECSRCEIGFYQELGESTVCLKCRANSLTVTAGAILAQDCVCEQGFFDCTSKDLGVCKEKECSECPFDAKCDQAEKLETLQTKGNFWRAINNTNVFYQCPALGACKGGRIEGGDRDSQCAEGYLGVRCEVCDYKKGYAIHQPGDKCSLCKPNEGRNSVYIAVAGFVGLLILAAITKLGLWPRKLSRVKRVAVISGRHAGRTGKLTGSHNKVDELNDAIRAAAKLHPPIQPHSAFELFSHAQRAESADKSIKELQHDWDLAHKQVKHGYEEIAQMEQEQYNLTLVEHLQIERALKAVYAVALRKDDGHDTTANVFVHGTDLQLRTMDLQEGYQARVTKIKISVQVKPRVCSRAPLLLCLTHTPTHLGPLCMYSSSKFACGSVALTVFRCRHWQ
jgi:hypothetical protein